MRWRIAFVIAALVLLVGCAQKTGKSEGLVEILMMPDDCGSDAVDVCCQNECTGFCTEHGQTFAKSTVNGAHCGCWCD